MDFIQLLRDHANGASPDERRALYAALRARVDKFASSIEGDPQGQQSQRYRDELEAAIRQFEVEQDVGQPYASAGSAPAPNRVSAGSGDAYAGAWKEKGDPAAVRPGVPRAPEAAPPARRSGVVLPALAVLLGLCLGAGALFAFQSVTRSAAVVVEDHYREGRAQSERNVQMVRSIRDAVEEYRRNTGTFPTTADAWNSFAAVAEAIPPLKTRLGQMEGPKERLLYRGSRLDYKLVLHQSGDCFIVRLDTPELVDPVRSAPPVDCYAYGFWTSGAVAW